MDCVDVGVDAMHYNINIYDLCINTHTHTLRL